MAQSTQAQKQQSSIICGKYKDIEVICYDQIGMSILLIHAAIYTMYDFHDSSDTLKFCTEKRAIKKTFFGFHLILMKFGEVVVIYMYYNFTKLHQNWMKNKKVLIIARFSVQNFKVSVEL